MIRTGRVEYVDEFGERIPEFTAQAMLPPWVAISFAVKRLGFDPFSEEELAELASVSAPVAQKWAGFVLPYMAELTLAGTLLYVMAPRVRKRREEELAALRERNKATAQTPGPSASPPATPQARPPAPPVKGVRGAPANPAGPPQPARSGDIPILAETRLADGPPVGP